MRHLLLTCLILLFLDARENPFKPVIDNTVLPVTSNRVEKAPPFKEVKVQLPIDARVLTSVAIYYQSIDGSIKKEIVAIDRSIDWHHPIVITQAAPATQAAETKKLPKPAVEAGKPEKTASKKPEKAVKTETKKAPAEENVYKPLPFVSLVIEKNRIEIVTKDEKIRSFHLTNPFKVAIDFHRKAGFLTKHKDLETPPFHAIDIGNHKGYYRVVITFDAPYKYRLRKTDHGYLLQVR